MFQAEVWCGQNGEDIGLGYMWSTGGPGVSRLGRAGGVGSCSSYEFGYPFCGDSSMFSQQVLSGGRIPGSCIPSTRYSDILFSFCPLSAGHKDSVTCAGFSHDSTLVATGDMSGLLKVWQVDTKEEVWSFEAGDLEVRSSQWDSTLRAGQSGESSAAMPP